MRRAREATEKLRQLIDPTDKEVLLEIAGEIVDEARQRVHVVTGYLRSTINIHGSGDDHVDVGALAPYAGFEEYGSSRQEAHPYLQPAVEAQIRRFANRVFVKLEAELT